MPHLFDPIAFRSLIGTEKCGRAHAVAMEEIARGLVHYDVPAWTGVEAEPLVMLPPNRRARR